MEYPEFGWQEIQALREKLGASDRAVVEGLLDKIESLWVELDRTSISSKVPFVEVLASNPSAVSESFAASCSAHISCSCPLCVPEKYAVRS